MTVHAAGLLGTTRRGRGRVEVGQRQATRQGRLDVVLLLREEPHETGRIGLGTLEGVRDRAQHDRGQVGEQRLHDAGLHASKRSDRAHEAAEVVAEQRREQAATDAAEARRLAAAKQAGKVAERLEVETAQ